MYGKMFDLGIDILEQLGSGHLIHLTKIIENDG